MDSPGSESAEDNQISQNDTFDSGISEDMKVSPENVQCSSKVKHAGTKENLDKILQLPIIAGERSNKKRKLEDDVPGSSGTLTSQEYLDKMSKLQELREKEKQLKIAIAYKKLRKEQPVFLDTDILQKKIAEYRRLLQEARSEHKMKNVMCVNLQLANTLQRIVGKTKGVHKPNSVSDIRRKCIEDLLKNKKELNSKIGVMRKEIAEIDEHILKLEKTVSANKQIRSKPVAGCSSSCTEIDVLEELERLKENNKKVAQRVHLLSQIIQTLISHKGRRFQEKPELLDMMAECEKVSQCQFDDLDHMIALLKSVCSVNLSVESTKMDSS